MLLQAQRGLLRFSLRVCCGTVSLSYSFAEVPLQASSFVSKQSQQCLFVVHVLVSSPGTRTHPRRTRNDNKDPSFPPRHQGRACDRRHEMSDHLMASTWVIHPAESAPEESQKRDADSSSHPPSGSASGPERKTLTPV